MATYQMNCAQLSHRPGEGHLGTHNSSRHRRRAVTPSDLGTMPARTTHRTRTRPWCNRLGNSSAALTVAQVTDISSPSELDLEPANPPQGATEAERDEAAMAWLAWDHRRRLREGGVRTY